MQGNSARKVRCARFARISAHCVHAIPKPTMSFRRQCPSPTSCQFSSHSYASSKVTVLAKLAVRASRAAARTACAQSQNRRSQFFGTPSLSAHAKFRPNPTLLATTSFRKTANSCEPPTKLQSFYCGPYGPKLYVSRITNHSSD